MRLSGLKCALLTLTCVLLMCSCGDLAVIPSASAGVSSPPPSSTGTPPPTLPPTPEPTQAPTPSPTPETTPEPTPTPTPEPTPTPDPWAGKFQASGAYISVKDFAKGPWIYRDETLSVEIQFLRGGPMNRSYYRAEIYTRGQLLRRGFAFQSDRGRTELPYKIARRYDAVIGITADYFNHKGNDKGVILQDGKVYHDKKDNTTLAILPDGGLAAYEPGEISSKELMKMGVKDTFSFGPILVKDGKINTASIKQHWLPGDAYEYRAGVGQIEKGHYVIIVTRGGFTMPQVAQLFVDNGCTMAYNMDGGHSACLIFMGEQLNQHYPGSKDGVRQRVLPDLMLLGFQPAVPDVKDKVFCNGVDYYPKNKPKPTDGPLP